MIIQNSLVFRLGIGECLCPLLIHLQNVHLHSQLLRLRWADAQVTTHDNLLISGSGCSHGTPSVKYRGIFLNDEQPALQNWAMEKFTNGTGSAFSDSPFNSKFYSKL